MDGRCTSRLCALAVLLSAGAAHVGCVGQLGTPDGEERSASGGDDGDGADTDSDDPDAEPEDEAPLELIAVAPVLPRLTAVQYRNALVDLLGPNLPATPVEPDTNPYLFDSIGASTTTLSELGAQQYEEAADAVTRAVFADPARRAALVGCEVATPGDGCAVEFLTSFGRRVVRRPLTPVELSRWVGVAATLGEGDAWEGLRLSVAGLLQSPSFLYRVEVGEPDPEREGESRLTGWEMATRLSFLLWNTIPSDALLDAAEAGDLDHAEGVAEAARTLLADDRARDALQEFFSQYLDLRRLEGVERNPETYPGYVPGMTAAMRAEVELLVDDVVFGGEVADARSIFSTRRTFVNSELAALYGVDAPDADPATFVPVEHDADGPRAGILTSAAFLTMNAHETQTSPTARGKYIRERVLCQPVPPPPDDVDTSLDPPDGDVPQTVREQLEEHRENPQCAGCHMFTDPPGLVFEGFDSVGAHRTMEAGEPVDTSGDLDGVPLADARALAAMLEDEPMVGHCMVTQLFRHAQSRLDHEDEEDLLDDLDERFAAVGYDFQSLIVEVVTHPGFRMIATTGDSQ